ncbi:MAG: class I SAM-dependent methyltransferase [Methylococcales bacterium]|nr:class I SAM-dependent methyltransferase [Methylococcales bacterium]
MMAAHHKYTNFYRAFEERHRGSRELIESRLEVYLPFVEPLKTLYEAPEILDLGCGRGEWLELLQHNGLHAKGVDLDEGMLMACRELNLDVCQADALDYLRGLEVESQSVVSAFHVVEHISFEALRQLVDEAYRVLKPGGLLILETPNSENLIVGTSSFYLDPTHQRPLPATLLTFVVEYAGFSRIKTLYLQDPPGLATAQQTTLSNVIDGVSPDYAVIAQKKATEDVCALFDAPFERSYGLRLVDLAERYDQQTFNHAQWLQNEWDNAKQRIQELSKSTGRLEAEINQQQAHSQWLQNEWDIAKQHNTQLQAHSQWLQNEWDIAKQHNTQLQAHAQWLQNEWDTAKAEVHELKNLAHHWWTAADQLTQEQRRIYSSRSWRITKPLRLLSLAVKKTINGIFAIPKVLWLAFKFPFKLMLAGLLRFILKRPKLKAWENAKLRKHPRLEAHLRSFKSLHGIVPEATAFSSSFDQHSSSAHTLIDVHLPHRTPLNTLGTLTIDELLSRIRTELAINKREGSK